MQAKGAAMAGGRKVVAFNKQRRQMTEFGNAERMLDHYGDGLMYVPEIDGWFMWTGIYWRRAAGVELEHLAKETIRALPDEDRVRVRATLDPAALARAFSPR